MELSIARSMRRFGICFVTKSAPMLTFQSPVPRKEHSALPNRVFTKEIVRGHPNEALPGSSIEGNATYLDGSNKIANSGARLLVIIDL